MTGLYLKVWNAMNEAGERREEGQGTVEYVGIGVVVVAVVTAAATFLGSGNNEIGEAINETVSDIIESVNQD